MWLDWKRENLLPTRNNEPDLCKPSRDILEWSNRRTKRHTHTCKKKQPAKSVRFLPLHCCEKYSGKYSERWLNSVQSLSSVPLMAISHDHDDVVTLHCSDLLFLRGARCYYLWKGTGQRFFCLPSLKKLKLWAQGKNRMKWESERPEEMYDLEDDTLWWLCKCNEIVMMQQYECNYTERV